MTKKIEHLTSELLEFFPEKNSRNIAKKIGNLGDMQEDFFASPYFKKQLKDRLKHLYTMEKKSSFSLLSFLKYSGVCASFLFVSGASYMYYTMQQENLGSGIEMRLQEEVSQASSFQTPETHIIAPESKDDVSSLETRSSSQAKSASPEVKTPTQASHNTQKQTVKNVSESVSDTGEVLPETSQKPVESSQKPVESSQKPVESSASLKLQESNEQNTVSQPEIFSESEMTQMRRGGGNDEYIITDIINTFEVPIQEEKALPSSDILPVGDHMMLKGVSPMMLPVSDSFIDICLSYSGSVSEDGEKCMFDTPGFCTRENIFPESETRCEYLPETPKEK